MVQLLATMARVALILPMLLSTTNAVTNFIWKTDPEGNPEECPCPAWTRGNAGKCVLFQYKENDMIWNASEDSMKVSVLTRRRCHRQMLICLELPIRERLHQGRQGKASPHPPTRWREPKGILLRSRQSARKRF